ncbi:hypothetical protein V1507DRAFT_484086 [Lipomyces tetrasporus]
MTATDSSSSRTPSTSLPPTAQPQRPQPAPDPNPPIAEYPILAVRRQLAPSLWASCLDCWCAMTEYFIAQPPSAVERATHLIRFLQTYVSLARDTVDADGVHDSLPDAARAADDGDEIQDPMARLLRRNVFVLLYRQYCLSSHVSNLDMIWGFVRLYARGNHAAIQKVIKHLGFASLPAADTSSSSKNPTQDPVVGPTDRLRGFIFDRIRSGKFTVEELHAVRILLRDQQIAQAWLTRHAWFAGLKAIVSTATARPESAPAATPAEVAVKVAYVSFVGLAAANPDAAATVFDGLRTQLPPPHEVGPGELLPALVVRTKIVARVRHLAASSTGGRSGGERLNAVVVALETIKLKLPPATVTAISACFRKSATRKTARAAKRRIKKMDVDAIGTVLDLDDARMVKEIKEIFPHLAEKYIVTLLAAKNNSVEEVLAYLVEQVPDRTHPDELADAVASLTVAPIEDGVVDNADDAERRRFENLEFAPGTLHYGRRPGADADEMLARGTTVSDKQKIFDSLRLIYDEDEDERDDTYDDVDALAHVYEDPEMDYKDKDDQAPASQPPPLPRTIEKPKGKPWENKLSKKEMQQLKDEQEFQRAENPNEQYLWGIYSGDKSVFETKQRGTKFRSEMKNRTNWTDEQLEGWAKVLDRDVRYGFCFLGLCLLTDDAA